MFKVRAFENRTLSWWYQERNNIDMEPVYQRKGGLWSPYDKAFLVDSILNDFDIPKLYIADFTFGNTFLNRAKKPFAVIDGKQRFEAIFDFFDGKIELDKEFKYLDDPALQLAQLRYGEIARKHPKIASKFSNYNLTVSSVITDEEEKISDLFVRLNRSKPLTGAEIRNAMSGVVPELTRNIAGHQFFTTCVKFQTERGQDKNTAAKLLLVEFSRKFTNTKKTQLDQFAKEGLISEYSEISEAAKRVAAVLDNMCEVFLCRDPLLSSSTPVIMYYWLVRNISSEEKKSLRNSLAQFDQARKLNRKIALVSPQQADAGLLMYDNLCRSADDQWSLELRYNMLKERLML